MLYPKVSDAYHNKDHQNARITIYIYKSSVNGISQFPETKQLCLFNYKYLFNVGFFLTTFQGYRS